MSYHTKYYHDRRNTYLALLGGKCVSCGRVDDLHFDHIDPLTKSFPIGKLMNFSKEKALDELKKCQILCGVCHREKTKSKKDNVRNRPVGEKVGNSVLTEKAVREILLRRSEGATLNTLMKEFPYKKDTIYAVISGITWKHVKI